MTAAGSSRGRNYHPSEQEVLRVAVVLLVGRYKDMADAAAEVLAPYGHRCVAALDPELYEDQLGEREHDIVILGPSLSPPERDRAEAVSRVSRREVPVLHVRTLDEALGLAGAVHHALDRVVVQVDDE